MAIFVMPPSTHARFQELPQELLVIGTTPEAHRHAKALAAPSFAEVPSKSITWGCGYLWNSIRDADHAIARGLTDMIFSTLVYLVAREIDELYTKGFIPYDSPILEARVLLSKLPDPSENFNIDAEVLQHATNIAEYSTTIVKFYRNPDRSRFEDDIECIKRLTGLARKMYEIA